MMTADAVLRLMDCLREAGIDAWLDGGWGVDALLGEQTRDHDDLDLVVELDSVTRIESALGPLGYEIVADERPTRLVLAGPEGSIDLHTVVFDEGGGGVQALPDGRSYRYPPEGFGAEGMVGGRALPCLSAAVQIECHLGYEPTLKDRKDMRLLSDRFNLRLPKAYR
jgi:lincosamide nucleotidyltransferase A/C/D/E